jgi:hypothetical protein
VAGAVTFEPQTADGETVLWLWAVGVLGVWMVLALVLAVIVGRGIRIADRRAAEAGAVTVITTADVLGTAADRAPAAARTARRTVPLPNLGVALVVLAIALEGSGYVARLTGTRGDSGWLLSMDAPLSLPRMFVAATFGAAALAAFAGAGSIPGRRTWWTAVGLIAAGITIVKAGGNIHAWALHSLTSAIGNAAAQAASVAFAAAVVGGLWFLSRNEQRDRRRTLSVLAMYAVAAVGLSALSSVVAGAYGDTSNWAAAATFVEESGEALAAIAFLMAVLAGVAPRLVLPAEWPLRRTVDVHTLELPEQVPGRNAAAGPFAL